MHNQEGHYALKNHKRGATETCANWLLFAQVIKNCEKQMVAQKQVHMYRTLVLFACMYSAF